MFGADIFEMGKKNAKEDIHVGSGSRNFKWPLVVGVVRKSQAEQNFFGGERGRSQAQGKLIEETAQNEEQRFERFDFIFEVERFFKNFWQLSQLQRANVGGGSAGEKLQGFNAESLS